MATPNRTEELEVSGEKLVAAVKKLVHEGNIRRISIRTSAGVTLLEIPLMVGIAGAWFMPVWAALGALAALVTNCRLVVERAGGPEITPRPRAVRRKAPRSTRRPRRRAA